MQPMQRSMQTQMQPMQEAVQKPLPGGRVEPKQQKQLAQTTYILGQSDVPIAPPQNETLRKYIPSYH